MTRQRVMTNEQFALTSESFRRACQEAKLEPTPRQAARWRNRKGVAWTTWQLVLLHAGIVW